MKKKQAVFAQGASKGDGPYSQAIQANGFVFVSGQGPLSAETGSIIGKDIAEQTKVTMDNIKQILSAANCSMDDVVKVNVYLEDIADYDGFNDMYSSYFSELMPARTCVACSLDDILVEIDVIALDK